MVDESKTIKQVYDGDPTGGNDETADYLIPADKNSGTAVVLSSQQLADNVDYKSIRVAELDGRISALEAEEPPPQPGPVSWFGSITANSLVFTVGTNNWDGEAYLLTFDDPNTPSYPGDFTGTWGGTGTFIPSQFPVLDAADPTIAYASIYEVRLWKYTVANGVEIVDVLNSIDSFVQIEPNDTIPPSAVTDLALSAGTDSSTQFKYLFSSTTDTGSGVAGYRLRVVDTNAIFLDPAIPDVLTEVSGRTPGETISLWAEAYDNSGNATNPEENDGTNTTSITLTTTTPGTAGIAALSANNYEDDENTNTATAVLQRTNGSSGAFQVTLSTKDKLDKTAEALIKGGTGHEFGTTADVSSANDTIDLSASSPGWSDGQLITYGNDGGAVSIGLTNATSYYVHDTGTDVYSFHTTYADSLTGASPVNLTASGAETQLILEGENVGYESLSNVVYSWADGVTTDQNVVVRLVDRGSLGNSYNNMFQLEIDHGSNTDGVDPAGAIGPINAALMLVNSSSSGTAGFAQDSVGTIAFEAEDSNSTIVADADVGTRTWNQTTSTRSSGGNMMKPTDSGVTRGTSTSIDPNACYIKYPLAITLAGSNTYDLFARIARVTSSESRGVHFTLERPVASIGADDSGGPGEFRVTMTEDHGYLTGDTIELEGTTNHDGTYIITGVPSTTTWDAANVSQPAQGSAAGVALLTAGTGGDSGIIGFNPISWVDDSPCQPKSGSYYWQWISWANGDSACDDRTFTIPAAGSWTLRMYQHTPQTSVDRICIAETSQALDPATTGDPPVYAFDDNMGPALSTYSSSSAAVDNPENPSVPTIPIPTDLEVAVTLEPANGAVDRATNQIIRAEFDTNVTNIIIQTMWVTTGGNPIAGSAVVTDNVVVFEKDVPTLDSNTTYTITGTGTCEVGGVLKGVSFGTWSFTTIDTQNDPDIIYQRNFNDQPLAARRLLTTTEVFNLLGCNYYLGDDLYLSPDPEGLRGMVLEQYYPPRTNGRGTDLRYDQYTGVQSVYLSIDCYCKSPWTFDGERGCKFIAVAGNNLRGTPLDEPGKASTSIMVRGSASTPYNFDVFDMYIYDDSSTNRGFGLNILWNKVDPTREPTSASEAVAVPKDRWFNVKVQMTMNTSASAEDGILRGWLDGVLMFERTNIRWTELESTREWDYAHTFSGYVGGGATWVTPNFGMSHYFDNAILTSTPI